MENKDCLLAVIGGSLGAMNKVPEQNIVFKVRFEFEVPVKTGRLFGRQKDFKQEAAETRKKKISVLEKVPLKGIRILEIDPHHHVYIKDEEGKRIACAPVEILFEAESLEDAIPFLLSKDFCGVILQSPGRINLSQREFEQVIGKVNSELRDHKSCLGIRYGEPEAAYLVQDQPPEDVPVESTAEEQEDTELASEETEDLQTEECPEEVELPPDDDTVKKVLRIEWDLEIVAVLSLILAGIIALGGDGWLHYVQIGLGLPFVLFFPGYVLIAALFPKKDDLDGIERSALSFGLSIAVAPLIGLGLNYTPWGIRLTPILLSLIVFIILMGCISFFRRDKLPENDRYCPTFQFELPVWKKQPLLDRVLSIALIAAILFAVGSICYVVAMPKVGEQFTEFYILGMDGKAEGYPRELAVGEEGEVIVGVVNHEYQQEKYFVEIKMDDQVLPREGPITLEHEEEWEKAMSFSYPEEYENLKVEFLLYREGDDQPYRSLHLWVNIQESEG